MLTLEELKEQLAERHDPDVLLEILDIDSSELVEAFHDKIEARYDELLELVDVEEEE